MAPASMPAAIPAIIAAQTGTPLTRRIAQVAAPVVNEPSTVRSGKSKTR